MKRRAFLKVTGAAVTCGIGGLATAQNRKGPNLVVIHTDEHNLRTLGCYRDTMPEDQAQIWGKGAVVETPHIDWLAQNGALSTHYYATSPVCTPSRASLVSGQYPHNTGAPTNNSPLKDSTVTFAEILRRQGYATGYAGKWHIDGPGKPQWGPKRQFGFSDNRYMFNRGHYKKLEDTPQGPRVAARNAKGVASYDVAGADEKSFTTDFLADKTVDFIRTHKNQPFCYMVSIPDPHGPNTVRAPYDTMFDGMKFKAPRTFHKPDLKLPGWAAKQKKSFNGTYMENYFGMVKCIDDNVGKIISALRKTKTLDNTIVVFTSDHGDLCGEHARDNKGVPFEMSARVPFILYYPKKVKAETIVPQTFGCVDFLPTIINMMGFKTAGLEEGRDLSPFFTGGSVADWKDISFMRINTSWFAAVTPRYKLVYSPALTPWLFDLKKDPDEIKNFFLDPEYRDIVRDLSKETLAYCAKHKEPMASLPAIQADLKWATKGSGPYVPPKRTAKSAIPKAKKAQRKS